MPDVEVSTGFVPVGDVGEAAGPRASEGLSGVSVFWLAKAMAAMRRTTTPTTVMRLLEGRMERRAVS